MQAVRATLDRIAHRLPGGPRGNRHLTALLGALLLLGILAELGTLVRPVPSASTERETLGSPAPVVAVG